MSDQPTAPNMRTFSLNSREFYEAMCEPRERPWIPNGALPREPARWRGPVRVLVGAENEGEADEVIRDWLRHMEAGRIGGGEG